MRILSRLAPATLALIGAICTAAAPSIAAETLDDGTTVDGWTLENGLRVTVRDIPKADAVAIIVAYPYGRDFDPEGKEGFTRLLAEVAFMAEAGGVPERTRDEMDGLRPVGWNVQVERARMEFAEMATPDQFPGVLHQVARRMAGVTVSRENVERSIEVVQSHLRTFYRDDPASRLYLEIGELAAGRSRESIERWVNGSGIEKVSARDLSREIERVCVPANAVLALAGDFQGINLRAFIEREFGGIAPGKPLAAKPLQGGTPGVWLSGTHAPLEHMIGALGVTAPALTDTLHPSFFMSMLMIGTHAGVTWGRPRLPLRSRFQYSILDDPAVARLYPPSRAISLPPRNLSSMLKVLADEFNGLTIDFRSVEKMHEAVAWMLGEPLPGNLRGRVTSDHPLIYRLCSTQATRELWGGEAFWKEYRRRFNPHVGDTYAFWHKYLTNPANQIGIVYQPPSN